MASIDRNGAGPHTETEESDTLLKRRRSRRVSFAETTAVHFFNRDEDSETTPHDAEELKLRMSESEEIKELLQSSSDDDDDDADLAVKTSFLRPVDSPGSGSCFGSATSNDEDNYFGPVSADFIKPGRLSDSAVSDEKHDVTMDSTAFSMHYQSLARSESGGEFKTPTADRLSFDDGTPSQIVFTVASLGDPMVLTEARKRISHTSFPSDKVNDSGNSDDMSVVGESHHRYDYGKLSPGFDVLLAESAVVQANHVESSNSVNSLRKETGSASDYNRCAPLDRSGSGDAGTTGFQKTSDEAILVDQLNIDKGNGGIADGTLCETMCTDSIDVEDDPVPETPSNNQVQAPIPQINGQGMKVAVEASGGSECPPSSARSKLDHEQAIAGSISSLLAKRRHIFKDSDNLPSGLLNSTGVEKELYDKVITEHAWSTSLFSKSASRLRRLEAFPFVSASKAEGNASRLTTPRRSTRSIAKNNHLGYGPKDISITRLDAPVACLDERFSNVSENDGDCRRCKVDSNALKNTGDIKHVSSTEEVREDVELLGLLTTLRSRDISSKPGGVMVSSSAASPNGLEIRMSRVKPEFELELPAIDTLQSMRSDCSLPEITFSGLKDSRETRLPGDFVFSPTDKGERNVSASPLYIGTSLMNSDQQGHSSSKLDRDSKKKKADDLSIRTKNSGTLFEKNAECKMAASDITYREDNSQESRILQNRCGYPLNSMFLETALADDSETGRIATTSTRVLPTQSMNAITEYTPRSDSRSNESLVQVSGGPKEMSCRLLQEEPCDLADDSNLHSVGEDVITPRSIELTNNDQLSLKPSKIYGTDSSSSLKRKLFDKAKDHNDEIASFQTKPKSHKDDKRWEQNSKVSESIVSSLTVFTNFCGATQQMLSPNIDKFDMALIGSLNDILVHLDKMRSYELLHHEVGYQKAFDSAHFLDRKRVVDTKSLLYRTMYEKAKLQLIRLKRDKLVDHVRQLNSRVEESKKLISSSHHFCIRGQTNVQIDRSQPQSCSTDIDIRILVPADLSSLRKESEDSDKKLRNLNQSFLTYIKTTEEVNFTKTAARVKDLLKKRVACRSLQSELQFCEVEGLNAKHGQPNILFHHGGVMSQRFIVKSISTSCLSVSNALNSMKISKMFLNIDAYTACSFVLSHDTNLPYEGLRSIAQETQKTSSLLHTLLDVIEEVELALMELRNLTLARFCQPSAGKLHLQLCFTDFSSGGKVTLSIDVTCLNRGVYPSQVLPCEVQGRAARKDGSFELSVTNIKTAIRGVRSGFMRIINICRCVSRMMIQANDMS